MDFEGKPICGGQMNSGPLDKEIYFLLWGERGGTAYHNRNAHRCQTSDESSLYKCLRRTARTPIAWFNEENLVARMGKVESLFGLASLKIRAF